MTAYSDALPEALDPESPVFKRAAKRRWWFLASVLVIAPLVLVVAGVLAIVIWVTAHYSAANRAVRTEVARIHAAGEPITVTDMHAYHRAKPGTNDTTHLWLAAADSLDEQQFFTDAQPLPIVGDGAADSLAAADLAAAEALLAKYDATVQLTLTAAQAEGECRFPVQYERGFSALLPNAQKMRTLARLLKLRGRVAAAKGETDKAVESVEALFGTSRSMSHQLLLIEHLVRLATATVALREVEALVSEAELTDVQLARLQGHIEALQFDSGLSESLLGERAMGYHTFHHMEQMSLDGQVAAQPPNPGEGSLSRPGDCALYLGFLREMIAASREPFPVAIDQAHRSEQRLQQMAGTRNPLERYNAMVTLLILPATTKSFEATGRNLALRDATLCALAAQRHRLKHGQLPAKLADLVPEFLPAVPTDPFDGQPLRMLDRVSADKGDALLFYSVGKDRKDDGGVETGHSAEPDIVVTLIHRR
jgi:hypothetical protein